MIIAYIIQEELVAYEAAMQRVVEEKKREQEAIHDEKKREIEAAEYEADQELAAAVEESKAEMAKLQRDFECHSLLRQLYNEAPDDVFELIVSKCTCLGGTGGLNALRLANKRCKQVVESCTTKLTNRKHLNGQDSLFLSFRDARGLGR